MTTKKLIFLFIGLIVLPTISLAAFPDVPTTHPNHDAIIYLQENGIIGGYPDGTFQPAKTVNRAEALKILLLGSNIETPEVTTSQFPDIDASAWFAKFVEKAKSMDIVSGYPDGEFKGENTLNLAEAMKMLLKTNNIDTSTIEIMEAPYGDVPANTWFSGFLAYAKEKNLLEADMSNMVYPNKDMSRADLAELMYRVAYMNENNLSSFVLLSETTTETEELNEPERTSETPEESIDETKVDNSTLSQVEYPIEIKTVDPFGDTENIEIINKGSSDINMTGFILEDDAGYQGTGDHTYIFPEYTLKAGETVIIYTQKGEDTESELYWGYDGFVWNNDGDTAYLKNTDGQLIDKLSY